MTTQSPKPGQRIGGAQSHLDVVIERPLERGPHVIVLLLDSIQPLDLTVPAEFRLGALGQFHIPASMPFAHSFALAAVVQFLARILPDGLQQMVAYFSTLLTLVIAWSSVNSPWSFLLGMFLLFTTLRMHLLGVALTRATLGRGAGRADTAAIAAMAVAARGAW